MKNSGTWREYMVQRLASDPSRVKSYLQAIMEEYQTFGDPRVVLLALRTVAEAEGGISALAKRINADPEALSKELSSDTVLTIDTLKTILNAFGCRLSIEPLETENPHQPTAYSPDARLIRTDSNATAASSKHGG
ncbi:MAG: transcriptional regulator [Candidatus Poribacteria bacterium]|nr:transcriptional regulator [Candidatus Poribacteria bacterium]